MFPLHLLLISSSPGHNAPNLHSVVYILETSLHQGMYILARDLKIPSSECRALWNFQVESEVSDHFFHEFIIWFQYYQALFTSASPFSSFPMLSRSAENL